MEADNKDNGLFWGLLLFGCSILAIVIWYVGALFFLLLSGTATRSRQMSEAMAPSIAQGSHLLIDKGLQTKLKRGDVVAVDVSRPFGNVTYIERVIGMPHDKVELLDGVIRLNSVVVPQRQISVKSINGDGKIFEQRLLAERLPGEALEHKIYDQGFVW